MTMIFADTFYWAALLNPRDQWHQSAKEIKQKLGKVRVVTTETVLIELLNFFSEYGAEMRQTIIDTARDILVDLDVKYISHSPEIFLNALDFYEKRLDKGYSLTDCVSMLAMKNLGLQEILTQTIILLRKVFAFYCRIESEVKVMLTDLAQVVVEKMQTLPLEKQQKVLEFVESIEESGKPQKQSLLDKLEAISKRVPDEVWEKLPTDGAENIDHYLYGTPKKTK